MISSVSLYSFFGGALFGSTFSSPDVVLAPIGEIGIVSRGTGEVDPVEVLFGVSRVDI